MRESHLRGRVGRDPVAVAEPIVVPAPASAGLGGNAGSDRTGARKCIFTYQGAGP